MGILAQLIAHPLRITLQQPLKRLQRTARTGFQGTGEYRPGLGFQAIIQK